MGSEEANQSDRIDGSVPGRPGTGPGYGVRVNLLGPLELLKEGVDYAPTTPKILQVLAMLVMRPGKVAHLDSIIEEVWADDPPRSVRTTMNTYIYHLRRRIERAGLAADGEAMLATKPPGYVFRIAPTQMDTDAFQRLRHQGHELLGQHRHAEAARCFRTALDLWSGPPMANVPCGPVLSAYAVNLLEQRRNVRHLRIEAEILDGMHRELVGELQSLVATNPLDEGLHGQLMRVLGRSGRRSDALASYRHLRARLNDELGLEPCGELQLLHHELLSEGEARR